MNHISNVEVHLRLAMEMVNILLYLLSAFNRRNHDIILLLHRLEKNGHNIDGWGWLFGCCGNHNNQFRVPRGQWLQHSASLRESQEGYYWCRNRPDSNQHHLWSSRSELNEPQHEISNNVVCVTSKGSDQPAHTRRLIRAFARRLNILWLLS